MQFIYVLPGWEGSAHDGHVLRDAISRSTGLKVPQGCYYLVDAGYCNSSGFLAPYRGHKYHLNEFDDPQKSIEGDEESEYEESDDDDEVEYIRTIAPTDQWNAFRNNMTIEMFNNWRNGVFNMG
ncbi:uncharacterized protein LOC122053459 [Zingiber officinale]|uniref:uncharacterized protein LOC122053459 n=1 Tax=Zingiber officinale TaxID=94328 RepID=UPI001C4C5B82|nr:uncharacterized protein LOC122053459 [Zingiber officinale]